MPDPLRRREEKWGSPIDWGAAVLGGLIPKSLFGTGAAAPMAAPTIPGVGTPLNLGGDVMSTLLGIGRDMPVPTATVAPARAPTAPAPALSPEDQIRKMVMGFAESAAAENERLRMAGLLVPTGTPMTQEMYERGMRGERGPLPWDVFTKTPGMEGKTFVGGWTDPSGKFQPLFEPKRNLINQVQDLIQQLAQQASSLIAGPPQAGRVESVGQLSTAINALLGTQQTGAKIPSEIQRNLAEAGRVQLAPGIPIGPGGEMGSFIIPPGGQPRQFAAGTPQERMGAEDQAINRSMALVGTISKLKADKQLLGQTTEQEDVLLSYLIPPIVAQVSRGTQPQHTDQSFMVQLQRQYPGQKPEWYQDQLRKAKAGSPQSFSR